MMPEHTGSVARERRAALPALAAYAVAMAFVESAVVVYLRQLYPAIRFSTDVPFSVLVYRTELVREAATIIMLLAVAYLAFGRTRLRVLAFFWIFAIWDLFYYVFLKVILDWPPSLLTQDVLFLIPIPWISPVWFPLGVWSAALAVFSYLLFRETKAA